MSIIIKLGIFLILMMFPLYFWAYTITLSDNNSDARMRFYTGLLSGIFSVGLTFVFSRFLQNSALWQLFGVIFIIFVIFYGIIVVITRFGSEFSRGFIRRISLWHLYGIGLIFCLIMFLSKIFLGNYWFGGIIISVFIPAFFEEITKHFGVLSLLGQKFRFSLRDVTIFAFCVAVGFTFVENFLYFYAGNATNFGIILRSFFTFAAHLCAVLICVLFWWKSLSYSFLSFRYFVWFLGGFIISAFSHFLFNFALLYNYLWISLVYLIASCALFVYMIRDENI